MNYSYVNRSVSAGPDMFRKAGFSAMHAQDEPLGIFLPDTFAMRVGLYRKLIKQLTVLP